jgi:hypothetical protein
MVKFMCDSFAILYPHQAVDHNFDLWSDEDEERHLKEVDEGERRSSKKRRISNSGTARMSDVNTHATSTVAEAKVPQLSLNLTCYVLEVH